MGDNLIGLIDTLCERVRATETLRAALRVSRAASGVGSAIADALNQAQRAETDLKGEIIVALAEMSKLLERTAR